MDRMVLGLYNPLSLVSAYRSEEISEQLRSCDMIVIPGTKLKAAKERAFTTQQLSCHRALHWGYGNSPFTNKSCGISILVNAKRFKSKHIVEVGSPPQCLAGRGGSVRVKQGALHLKCIGGYWPVCKSGSSRDAYLKTVRKMKEWIEDEIHSCPATCTPCLLGDLNEKFRPDDQEDEQLMVGPYGSAEAESFTASTLRKIMYDNDMCVIDTFFDLPDTYYHHDGNSTKPDHIIIPNGLRGRVRGCEVWKQTGRRLQLIPDFNPRDHYPMILRMDVPPACCTNQMKRSRWNQDAISDCQQNGERRTEFLAALEEHFKQDEVKIIIENMTNETTADNVWEKIIYDIKEIGLQYFSKSKTKDEKYKEAQEYRRSLLRLRATLREQVAQAPLTELEQEITLVTAMLKRHKKAKSKAWKQRIIEDLWNAWRERAFSRVHRLSRLLAGTSMGAKRRFYNTTSSTRPSAEEWAEVAVLEGRAGGLNGVIINFEEEKKQHIEEMPRPRPYDANDEMEAKKDLRQTKWEIAKAKKRKAGPEWCLPIELWNIILSPKYLSKPKQSMAGVGAEKPEWATDHTKEAITKAMTHIRRVGWVPLVAHKSKTWQVDKRNGKKKTASLRLLHGLSPFWRCFYRGKLKSATPWRCPHYSHGGLKGRRREDATLAMRISTWRLRKAKKSFLPASYDMTNAFCCSTHEAIKEFVEPRLEERDQEFFRQRRGLMVAQIEGHDQCIEVIMRNGGMQGDGNAPEEFAGAFQQPVQAWLHDTSEHTKDMIIKVPWSNQPIHSGFCTFVDDLFRIYPVPSGTAAEAQQIQRDTNAKLDRRLAEAMYSQNTGKQEVTPYLKAATENRKCYDDGFLEGRALTNMKYLGGNYNPAGSNVTEREARLASLHRGFADLRGFWFSGGPKAVKRMLFMMKVQGAAITAMETYLVTATDCRILDTAMGKYLRAMMKGAATNKTGEHYVSVPASEVWKHWRLAPTALELLVRRLKWYQAMVTDKVAHAQIIAVMFGQTKYEQESTLDDEGRVRPEANP